MNFYWHIGLIFFVKATNSKKIWSYPKELGTYLTWWRHQMETFSSVLALCAGNSPVTGEFPSQSPVTRSFDISFDMRLNKRLSIQSWGWLFETPSRSLWRHCYVSYLFLACECHPDGTVNLATVCNKTNGQCPCKPHTTGRDCSTCADGYYRFPLGSPDLVSRSVGTIPIDRSNISHNAPAPYPIYGTGAPWDLWEYSLFGQFICSFL